MALGTQAGALGSGSFGALPDPIATLTKDIKPKAALGPTPGPDIDQQLAEAAEQTGQLKMKKEIEEAKGAADIAKAEAAGAAEEARLIREDPYRKQMQQKIALRADTTFVPTKENVADIGGLFTLTNLIGFMIGGKSKGSAQQAMSAMNGMLEGHQKGREDLYKQQKDLYEINMRNLDKTIDSLAKEYQDAINLYARDRTAGLAAARDAVAKHNADFIKDAQEKYGMAYAYDKLKEVKRLKDQKELKEAQLKQKEADNQLRRDLALMKAGATGSTPAMNQDIENAAQAIANFSQAPPGLRDKNRYQIMARVRAINPGYVESDYGNTTKAYQHYTDPQFKGAQQIGSFITVAEHLDVIDGLAKALENKDVPGQNVAINYFKTSLGHPEVTNFNTAKQAVGAEIVKAIEGGPGALADRQEAMHLLDASQSPEQLRTNIKVIKDLIKARLETTKYQYQLATKRSDFDKLLPPAVQRSFGEVKAKAENPSDFPIATTPEEKEQYRKMALDALWDGANEELTLYRYKNLTGEDLYGQPQ